MNLCRCIAQQLAGLIAVVLFSATFPAAASDLPIYTDSLASGWSDYSWDVTRNLSNTSPTHTGTQSIAVTVTAAWGGYCLNAAPVSTSSYDQLGFWVNGGTNGGQKVWFVANFNQQTYSFTPSSNAWTLVNIPLSALGNPGTLTDLCWQDTSSGAQSTFYIDDITLIQRPSVPTADLPIYTDALAGGWEDWSWGSTRNFTNTSPIHGGADSLAVTLTDAWGALYLHPDAPIDTYGYSEISFWVHGGSAGNKKLGVSADFGAHNFPVTATAGAWTQVKVPLSALGSPATLTDLTWQDATGGAQPTFYLDDITLSVGSLSSHILTIAKASGGTGTLTSSPAGIDCGSICTANYNSGTQVILTATPSIGYSFSGWSGACTGTGTCTVTMDAAKNVTASFIASQSLDACAGTTSNVSGITIVGSPTKRFGDSLEVDYCLKGFNSATKFDIYIAVSIPDGNGTLLFAQSLGFFGQPIFSNQIVPFLSNTLIQDVSQPVLSIPALPLYLPTGPYTFYMVPVLAGNDVMIPSNWIGSLAQGTLTLTR
jgi:hypothetical protein